MPSLFVVPAFRPPIRTGMPANGCLQHGVTTVTRTTTPRITSGADMKFTGVLKTESPRLSTVTNFVGTKTAAQKWVLESSSSRVITFLPFMSKGSTPHSESAAAACASAKSHCDIATKNTSSAKARDSETDAAARAPAEHPSTRRSKSKMSTPPHPCSRGASFVQSAAGLNWRGNKSSPMNSPSCRRLKYSRSVPGFRGYACSSARLASARRRNVSGTRKHTGDLKNSAHPTSRFAGTRKISSTTSHRLAAAARTIGDGREAWPCESPTRLNISPRSARTATSFASGVLPP
mmetsp:Transcript_39283/g.113585  ORF Transcript_39283/g.113585 Transcript_39283/m.113585 type:complete len:291 (+) Transcript_39283:1303-2175(+)